MKLPLDITKGAFQYASSYITTFVEFLRGPIVFLQNVLTSSEKQKELKRAFLFVFLPSYSFALLTILSTTK